MKTILSLVLTTILGLSSLQAWAQEIASPDYPKIRQAINNNKSEFYYPRLMERYHAADTTLTLEDYRLLYYGFSIREDFVPYQSEHSNLLDIRRKLMTNKDDRNTYNEALRISKEALEDNPFDLPALSIHAISYLLLGDTISYNKWNSKRDGIMEAITSSGDGETAQTAFHVINIKHEYEILIRNGLEPEKRTIIDNKVEYIKVKENTDGIEGIYFNFDACSSIYRKKYQ